MFKRFEVILKNTLSCDQLRQMYVDQTVFDNFPAQPSLEANNKSEIEKFFAKVNLFFKTAEGIAILSLSLISTLLAIGFIAIFVYYRKAVFLRRFMISEIEKLLAELEEKKKPKPTEEKKPEEENGKKTTQEKKKRVKVGADCKGQKTNVEIGKHYTL